MTYKLSQISKIVKGALSQGDNDFEINNISIDSRKILQSNQTIFIAIQGERHDGNNYVRSLMDIGIKNFIVDKKPNFKSSNINLVLVKDSLKALQELTSYHRQTFSYPVIGITGSNGKTIVKEWVFHLLKDIFNIVRSPKSYNSQVGVPLSLWEMSGNHNLAIIEAGISKPGEMDNLANTINPSIGVITNIGDAHSENFINRQQKIKEKIKLVKTCNKVIYNKDIEDLHEILKNETDNEKLISWSRKNDATIKVKSIEQTNQNTSIKILYDKKEYSFVIPFIDEASINNVICCVAICISLNVDLKEILPKIPNLSPIAMRMQLLSGKNNNIIINDTYNSDVNSLEIALNFLDEQHHLSEKIVILSDILQSRTAEPSLYKKVSTSLNKHRIDHFFGIGPAIYRNKELFNLPSNFFLNTQTFLEDPAILKKKHASILIKGARSFNFEKITRKLQEQTHETTLKIDLNALVSNLNHFKTKLNSNTKIMGMVKAFSYGTGSFEIANTLEFNRVDYLAVAYTDEGVSLRKAGIKLPIMVMSADENSYSQILEFNLEPEIFNLRSLKSFYNCAKSYGFDKYPIHIKLDTGMHRLGFEPKEVIELINFLKNQQILVVSSVFTHLAGSESAEHDDFTQAQMRTFEKMSSRISNSLKYSFLRHALNSSGILRFPNYQLDMVRLGIGLYGITNEIKEIKKLKPVATLSSHITQIKFLNKGETVGYGRKGKVTKNTTIATIPIGYGDGLNRRLGNGIGHFNIKSQKAKILGDVCMDMTMIDITGLEANEGDEVIIFGENPSIAKIANQLNTIPYEILCGISRRVKRVYYQD